MPRLRVKFCGIMSVADALAAAEAGTDAIGMVLHAAARRKIDLPTAAAIIAALPPYVTPVGLFVDAPPTTILETARVLGLSVVQLHGDEPPADVELLRTVRVVKALRVDGEITNTLAIWRDAVAAGRVPNLAGLLLDGAAGGGTGIANDFGRIKALQQSGALAGLPPLVVAGGLGPTNVGEVVRLLRPFAVDTSSGIEAEFGRKSPQKMQAFYDAATRA